MNEMDFNEGKIDEGSDGNNRGGIKYGEDI